jgi:hypothetical protein
MSLRWSARIAAAVAVAIVIAPPDVSAQLSGSVRR